MRYEKELREIDSRNHIKPVARDEMEEFLAGKGIDKVTRLSIVLDYIMNKALEPKITEAEMLYKKLVGKYREIADMKAELSLPFRDKAGRLEALIEQADKELSAGKALLRLVTMVEG